MRDTIEGLKKIYTDNGYFIFYQNGDLKENCKDLKDSAGVYIMFTKKDIIYIGRSGKINNEGKIKIRKDGGLYARLVKGKQFGEQRHISLPKKMKEEGINF